VGNMRSAVVSVGASRAWCLTDLSAKVDLIGSDGNAAHGFSAYREESFQLGRFPKLVSSMQPENAPLQLGRVIP